MLADPVRVATPYPCPPSVLVEALVNLVKPLPSFDRVSVGFPGVVRHGEVITGGENHSCNISDGGYLHLFEAVIMFALTQSSHSYYSREHRGVNRLCRMRVSAEIWHVRFSAVRNETAPPKAS